MRAKNISPRSDARGAVAVSSSEVDLDQIPDGDLTAPSTNGGSAPRSDTLDSDRDAHRILRARQNAARNDRRRRGRRGHSAEVVIGCGVPRDRARSAPRV